MGEKEDKQQEEEIQRLTKLLKESEIGHSVAQSQLDALRDSEAAARVPTSAEADTDCVGGSGGNNVGERDRPSYFRGGVSLRDSAWGSFGGLGLARVGNPPKCPKNGDLTQRAVWVRQMRNFFDYVGLGGGLAEDALLIPVNS